MLLRMAIISSLNGGVAKFTISLSRELSHFDAISNIDIFGFATKKRIPIPTLTNKIKIKVFSHPLRLLFWLFNSLTDLNEYDIIQVHQAIFALPLILLKFRRINFKMICSSRTAYIFEHLKIFEKVIAFFDLIALLVSLNFLDSHTTFSEFNRNILKERYGLNPIVIHNGIDPISYHPSKHEREIMRQKLGFMNDSFLILYLGLLLRYKNVINLITAMPSVLEQVPSAKLHILGRGPCLKEILDEIIKLKMDNYITVDTTYVEDTSDYYFSADLFAFPAADGTHVLLEAMACGLPIVYANSCSSPEIVGEVGINFKINDVNDLYEKIVLMATDDDLRMEKSKMAKERIRYFDWSRVARKYYELYVQ